MCVCWVGWGVAVICAQAYARARVCVCAQQLKEALEVRFVSGAIIGHVH